jgi:hypothetical protein
MDVVEGSPITRPEVGTGRLAVELDALLLFERTDRALTGEPSLISGVSTKQLILDILISWANQAKPSAPAGQH